MCADDVIILLGAGASCDAKLASSLEMTSRLEAQLKDGGDMSSFAGLYRAVKASILYGYALDGRVDAKLNIEELVNVLNELEQFKKHTIYPFVASWNMELMEYAGKNFCHIHDFKDRIIEKLVSEWIFLENNNQAEYYKGLYRFASTLGSCLRVFSLNYDMCVEYACGEDHVYRGFELDEDGVRVWDDRNMQVDTVNESMMLYKLHGSLDWTRDNAGRLICHDHVNVHQSPHLFELIFGTSNKMRYEDPYLFLLSQFRKYALEAKVIICIGYSFGDAHINKILQQAGKRKAPYIISVTGNCSSVVEQQGWIGRTIDYAKSKSGDYKIRVVSGGAKEFLTRQLSVPWVTQFMVDGTVVPF